jgi:LacI family transcriptional regulator
VLLGELYTAASSAGYLLMTVDAVQRPLQVDALLDRRVDGFVIVAPELAAFAVPEHVTGVPTVMVNCFDPTLAASSLVPDEVGAGVSAAQHLFDAGHRRLGVLVGLEGLAAERRLHGVCQMMRAAGLPEPAVAPTSHTIGDGYHAARRLLESDLPPSGLVCTHERLALGALLAAHDVGLNVPDDLSLVSLDDGEDLAGSLVPPVTLVERPDAAVAQHALDMLVEQLHHGHGVPRQLTFVCPVRPGGSVAAPRPRVKIG